MRISRKYSRKKYLGLPAYEYERFFIPVPARGRGLIRPLYGRDLEVFMEPLEGGLAILLCPKEGYAPALQRKFREALKAMKPIPGDRETPPEKVFVGRDTPVEKILELARRCPLLADLCNIPSYADSRQRSPGGSRSPLS